MTVNQTGSFREEGFILAQGLRVQTVSGKARADRGSWLWRQKREAACLCLDRLASRGAELLPLSLIPSDYTHK